MAKKQSRTTSKPAAQKRQGPVPLRRRKKTAAKKRSWSLAEEQANYCTTPFAGQSHSTIDLFCGAGGLTEGFRRAGFQCAYANDINSWAIESFQANHPGVRAEAKPIEKIDVTTLRRELHLSPGELDVLVGGPPCQGFSINAPERFLADPRNSLFRHYVRFLDEFRPKTLLMENVPGMLSLGNGVIFEQIISSLQSHGYRVAVKILFAAHYGVPQERWRTIILGSRADLAPEHPEPTHYALARANFKGGRTMTFQQLPLDSLLLKPAVTIGEALGDMPRLEMGSGGEIATYDRPAASLYAQMLRSPDGVTYNHFAGKLSPQNAERMKHVRPGGSWRDIPRHLLPCGMQKAKRTDHTKRYGRLRNDGLAGTVLTKCDPHWGAVFLPDQNRALTVREAARIQSFPDNYKFLGPRVSQYEQVGNAVPVLLGQSIASQLRLHLERYFQKPELQHVAQNR